MSITDPGDVSGNRPAKDRIDSLGNPADSVVAEVKNDLLYETDGTFPKTSTVVDSGDSTIPTNRFALDVPNYTGISTPSACLAAEVAGVTFPAGSNVTGIIVSPVTASATASDLVGVMVTVNAGSAAAAATALTVDTTAGGAANENNSDFCPANQLTKLVYDTEITDVYITSIGNDTPNNYVFVKGI